MSMYAEYVRERLGDSILEREDGFATYRYLDKDGKKCVYIVDIYVRAASRKGRVASEMADCIVALAKLQGCTILLGTVMPTAIGSTDSLKVLLGYGMSIHSCKENLIVFEKEI